MMIALDWRHLTQELLPEWKALLAGDLRTEDFARRFPVDAEHLGSGQRPYIFERLIIKGQTSMRFS